MFDIGKSGQISETHSLGRFLRSSTESAFDAVGFRDREVIEYVWKMLLRFVHVDQLFRRSRKSGEHLEHVVDFLTDAQGMDNASVRELKRHMGDVCLFFAGLYPENLEHRKRNPDFYVSQGKAAYYHVAEIDALRPSASFYRKLTDKFEECVMALHLEREFMHDSVYQYIGRQFGLR
ncbi:MAG: hypothetical protein QF701_04480 [Nitrospinota bacterium]|jgi:hypothetical protein|nr:hypothetical protein [Nitrospinota bacterium]MDP7167003.1 hypothetical protein [Nitrospinota bacterium]|tara:strand:+ start:1095 stop:1625 length:531 start_codon:yes stop_codon:yes gene_type:complete